MSKIAETRKVYNDLLIDEIDEISAVDDPAQVGARAVIFKRAFSTDQREALADSGAALPDGSFPVSTVEDLKNAIQAIGRAKDRGRAIAHIRRRAVALGAADLIPESFGKNDAGDPGEQGTQMTETKNPADEIKAANDKLVVAQAELAIAKSLGEFSDAEKALYRGMDQKGQESFRKLSPADRDALVREADEKNAVVYKTLDGETFRKSDDPRLVAIAKRADEDRKALISERISRRDDEFKKRAVAELPNLPGAEDVKVAVLRSLETIENAEIKKGALALLAAGNSALSKAFETKGTIAGGDGADPHSKLEGIAKGLREKNPKLDVFSAYTLAAEQNPELYADAINAPAVA